MVCSVVDGWTNAVPNEPEVDCGVDGIAVTIATERPFRGRLYVQGQVDDASCVSTFHTTHTPRNTADTLQFALQFGDCNMKRQRTLNPRGVAYSFDLIVSFHPMFITQMDKAYRIRCFFVESVKAIEATLEVGHLNTETIEEQFVLPQCNYELRESRDGPLVRFANVGDHLTHVWHCDNVAGFVYGMLIHSCYVDDGHGDRVQLIDDNGCVDDPVLISGVAYEKEQVTAFAETHVFKYADRTQVLFTCTVQLCFKNDGGCDSVTPPSCSSSDSHQASSDRQALQQQDASKEFFSPMHAEGTARALASPNPR